MASVTLKYSPGMLQQRREIGKRLRALRHDKNSSIAGVARSVFMKANTLGYIERGRLWPHVTHLVVLSAYYGVSIEWILFGGQLKRELRTPMQAFKDQLAAPVPKRFA